MNQTQADSNSIVGGGRLSLAALWRLARAIAWTELDQRYKRTKLGRNWITLSFLFFVGVKVVIFGTLNDVPLAFFAPYLAIGLMVFRTISQGVTGGAGVFVSAGKWIKTETLPLHLYLSSFAMRTMIQFLYMAAPTFAICGFFGAITWAGIVSLPFAVVVYSISIVWVAAFLGILAARYRDLVHVLSNLMQILYFATPILWVPTETGVRSWVAFYNPFTHYIAILREPLLTGTVPWISWIVVTTCTTIGCILAFIFYQRRSRRLVYWI